MKRIALFAVLLLCVSVVSAAPVGTIYKYTFDGLSQYSALWNNTDGTVTWSSVTNMGAINIYPDTDYAGDKRAQTNSSSAEGCFSSLTNYPTTKTLFPGLDSSNTQFRFTADCHVNFRCGWLLGIWEDGLDSNANSAVNNPGELEKVVQMGTTYVYMNWRVRGTNGTNSTMAGTPPTNPILDSNDCNERLILDIDLAAGGGDGRISFSAKNLVTGVVDAPPELQNVSMGLASNDPTHTTYGDPSKWSGFCIRNQRYIGGDNPTNGVGYHTVDDMTLEVMPEPASLSLVVLGGLLCLRRRR